MFSTTGFPHKNIALKNKENTRKKMPVLLETDFPIPQIWFRFIGFESNIIVENLIAEFSLQQRIIIKGGYFCWGTQT